MILASKIRMQKGKEHDNDLTSIESIYLTGSISKKDYYTKEDIHDWLEENTSHRIQVDIDPHPDVTPAKRGQTKYVKSVPDTTDKDNLLSLPRDI